MKTSIFIAIIALFMSGYAYSEQDDELSGYVYNWQQDMYYGGKSAFLNDARTRTPASIQRTFAPEKYNSKEDNYRYIFFD